MHCRILRCTSCTLNSVVIIQWFILGVRVALSTQLSFCRFFLRCRSCTLSSVTDICFGHFFAIMPGLWVQLSYGFWKVFSVTLDQDGYRNIHAEFLEQFWFPWTSLILTWKSSGHYCFVKGRIFWEGFSGNFDTELFGDSFWWYKVWNSETVFWKVRLWFYGVLCEFE